MSATFSTERPDSGSWWQVCSLSSRFVKVPMAPHRPPTVDDPQIGFDVPEQLAASEPIGVSVDGRGSLPCRLNLLSFVVPNRKASMFGSRNPHYDECQENCERSYQS